MAIMDKIERLIERLLFGATAQERVDMMAELAARRALARLAASIATDGPEYDAQYDEAFVGAQARGLGYDEAHAEAARVADAWKATQRAETPASAPERD